MDEPFLFFYWIFVDFFSFSFLAKIEIPKVQYKLEGRGLNMLG